MQASIGSHDPAPATDPATPMHKAMTRWYFGWNIVAASALLTLLSSGMRLSIGPFFLPIAQDLGFSRSLLASEAFGWRATLVGFAATLTLVAIPAALFIMRDQAPEGTDLRPTNARLLQPPLRPRPC